MKRIEGGATIWARKTVDSVIFYDKPDKWFKIWFFVVNRVNHRSYRKWERGQCFVTYGEIMLATKATRAQVDMCFRFLKISKMLTTQKTTRGMTITVINYALYQDLDNYKNDTENDSKTTQERHRNDTINKNVKKEKNISEPKVSGDIPLTDNQTTVGWKNKPSDNDDDLQVIDLDSRKVLETEESKQEKETKELNAKIRANLKTIEPLRGIPWGTGKDMNFHVKIYRDLLKSGHSHASVVSAFMDIVDTPHWKEKKSQGEYPGMNTVQFHLRNKKPL